MTSPYIKSLSSLRISIMLGGGVSYDSAATIVAAVAKLSAAGQFPDGVAELGTLGLYVGSLSEPGHDAGREHSLAPEELAFAAWAMAKSSRDRNFASQFIEGTHLPSLPRQQAADIVQRVTGPGVSRFPESLSLLDFGQALASLVAAADNPVWIDELRRVFCSL